MKSLLIVSVIALAISDFTPQETFLNVNESIVRVGKVFDNLNPNNIFDDLKYHQRALQNSIDNVISKFKTVDFDKIFKQNFSHNLSKEENKTTKTAVTNKVPVDYKTGTKKHPKKTTKPTDNKPDLFRVKNRNTGEIFIYCRPLKNGIITSLYGYRIHPVYHKISFHNGIDISCPVGTKVYVWKKGKVIKVKRSKSYGLYVIIKQNNGIETIYAHLSKVYVSENSMVKAGDVAGLSGNSGTSTGPHLHFEIRYKGKSINPENFLLLNAPARIGMSIR